MVKRFCVLGCGQGVNIRFFQFPSNQILRRKWCENLGYKGTNFAKKIYVCSRHFPSHFIANKRLNTMAVPTLELGVYGTKIHDNHSRGLFVGTKKKCAVPGCTSTAPPMPCFKLVRSSPMRPEWLRVCGIPSDDERDNLYFCSLHFSTEAGRRRKRAIPEFNLPTTTKNPPEEEQQCMSCAKDMIVDPELEEKVTRIHMARKEKSLLQEEIKWLCSQITALKEKNQMNMTQPFEFIPVAAKMTTRSKTKKEDLL